MEQKVPSPQEVESFKPTEILGLCKPAQLPLSQRIYADLHHLGIWTFLMRFSSRLAEGKREKWQNFQSGHENSLGLSQELDFLTGTADSETLPEHSEDF